MKKVSNIVILSVLASLASFGAKTDECDSQLCVKSDMIEPGSTTKKPLLVTLANKTGNFPDPGNHISEELGNPH